MYAKLAQKLRDLGHEDMAKLIDELDETKTPTECILQDLGINSNLVKRAVIPWLWHIRVFHGLELERRRVGWQSLEELEKDFPFSLTLLPRVPGVDAEHEDSSTPRVSLAHTIEGAASSLGLARTHSTCIAIYATMKPTEIVVPFNAEDTNKPERNILYVHDAGRWGEVWSLRPVPVERIGIIKPGENIY